MTGTILSFLACAVLSAGLVAFVWFTAQRLAPEGNGLQLRRWLVSWSIRGFLVPFVIWALMNVGLSLSLQPFMPSIQSAQHRGGPWVQEFLKVAAIGLWIISSYWTATTLGWLVVSTGTALERDQRKDFRTLCWTCGLGLGLPVVLVFVFSGWAWFGVAAVLVLGPIAALSPNLLHPPKVAPIYARAIARIKFGKYSEAEWEIIQQLEKSEDDFDGWMMLAELYANYFGDLREAEKTIQEICRQPSVTASQISVALHRLADWHLKLGQNPVAARRAMQTLADRLKGTHLARMALLRQQQIPVTAEEFREQQNTRAIPLPALGDTLDDERGPEVTNPERKQAARTANALVERLKENPNNVAAREKLARIFTERLSRPDLGIEQLTLLLGMPGMAESTRAEWLGLTAAWHLKYRNDTESARALLERLLREFPQTPQAFAARRRLELIERAQAARKTLR